MSKKDDEINRQLIFNSGGANPEDYLTPKQLQRYQDNPDKFIDIDVDLAMNKEEELAAEYNERKLKEEVERYEAQNQEAYDKEVSGENFLKDRAEENEEDEPDAGDIAKGVSFEIAAGLATDKLTAGLLNPLFGPTGIALYGLANFASGSIANIIAQRLRGDTSFSLGEVLSSGAVGIIPGTQLKAGKAFQGVKTGLGKAGSLKRAAISGGLTGVGAEQIRVGIDEGRFLTAQEALLGGAVGGTVSAGMQKILDAGTVGLQNYAKNLKPIEVFASKDFPDDLNLPIGDAQFKLKPETPFYRTLTPEAQKNLRKFARTNLNKDSWEDLGLAAKYEGTYDQGDWDRYLQTVLDQQDQTQFIIRMMNKIYTEQELKTGDLDEFGVRLADMFRLPEPVDKAGLQKIIRNEGGIIYLRTPRMRRNKIPALEVTNLEELQTAIEDRLADIATDPYFEYGHIRAVLNILQDNDAINNANFLGNFQAEPTRSIVRSLFRGKGLDELLDGPIDSVVEEFGNRATKAAADLDVNVNRVEGTASNLEESFLNYMKPELDVANAVPVQLRQRLVDDYVAQVAEEGDDLAAYGINLNDPETPFNIDGINLAVFKDVLSKYKSGGVSLLQMLQVDEYVKLLRQFPEMIEEILITRPGQSADFGINYLSNQKMTTEQKSLLASLRKKVDSLSPLKTKSKTIKKKETESGKFADPFRKKTKPKKKFNKKDDDNNNPPVTGSKPKK